MKWSLKRLKVPKGASVGFFLVDRDNGTIITSEIEPGNITIVKNVVFAKTPAPGASSDPLTGNRAENKVIGFSFQVMDRNDPRGIQNMMSKIDLLTEPILSLRDAGPWTYLSQGRGRDFRGFPRIIFYRGTYLPPLQYHCTRCSHEMLNSQLRPSPTGFARFANITIELTLDEDNGVYRAWQLLRIVNAAIANEGTGRNLIRTKYRTKRQRL
jgi:hypothetical protein